LIDEAEGPGERLVKLFEPEVLAPEAGVDVEDEGKDGGNDCGHLLTPLEY